MRKWIPLFIVVAAIVASAAVYQRLPETIPTHWDVDGHVNGWSSRAFGAWITPVLLLGLWALVRILPAIDPKGANYAKFGGAFEAIIESLMLFLLAMHILVLRAGLGQSAPIQRVVPIGAGFLLIVVGNLLPRMRPNWFIGIRTPWTLSSDRVWEKTHRFGGRVFVAGGILIVLSAFASPQAASIVLVTVVVLAAAVVLIYSYAEWKREQSTASTTR
jgi:uncharacterized membrane protein